MSLVNEALKRAKQVQTSNASARGPALRPVDGSRAFPGLTVLALAGLLGLVLLLSALLFWQWSHAPALQVRAKSVPVASPVVVAPPPPAPVVSTPPPPIPQAAPADLPAPEPVVTNAPVSAPAPPPPPAYKLQGVFYRPGNASALINGKTVVVGNHVNDALVVAIGRDSATLVTASGQTNVLELR